MKEATARSKINKLPEAAGWRFFADDKEPGNVQLERNVKLTKHALICALGRQRRGNQTDWTELTDLRNAGTTGEPIADHVNLNQFAV